jgi:allantoinase
MHDLVVRGGTIVTPAGRLTMDIGCEDGRIVALDRDLPAGREDIDASELVVLPGMIDVHLHFNEPGRTEWEGAATGSRAFAAGGGTVFFDMPLNSTPCTVNPHQLARKRTALEASAITDFGLWGGLIPGAVTAMAEMAAEGVVGFKAFMCDSGLPEFPRADDETLAAGMREAARLGSLVAVHAESEALTRAAAAATRGRDAAAFLASRPLAAELDAIDRALRIAGETGVRLHIVHVSSGSGVARAVEARRRGVDVSIETCPHYLTFTADDLERLGTVAKCAPPFRSPTEQADLWRAVIGGGVDVVASDHSPTEPARKQGDFLSAWGGVAGVQSTLPVLLDRALSPGGLEPEGQHLTLERIASLIAGAPSRRFGIAAKGTIEIGRDADLVLMAAAESFTLAAGDLLQRHAASPYVGRRFRGRIRRTIRRGETIFIDGRITALTRGRFVAASRTQP